MVRSPARLTLFPYTTLFRSERVVVHNNAVIGCDGFGYAKDEQKRWLKIPQTGRVVIEDDVEIGAGTTIDRASVGERDRKSTRLNSSHVSISYAVFCLKKKNE